jgi:hypothetical protein
MNCFMHYCLYDMVVDKKIFPETLRELNKTVIDAKARKTWVIDSQYGDIEDQNVVLDDRNRPDLKIVDGYKVFRRVN